MRNNAEVCVCAWLCEHAGLCVFLLTVVCVFLVHISVCVCVSVCQCACVFISVGYADVEAH